MANQVEHIDENAAKDFTRDWVKSSRFLFYLTIFSFLMFVFSCSFRVYKQGYKGKPDIEIQGSTKYTPEYK